MPELSGSTYSETDASNNAAAPNGMPEGMAPSGVNDAWRAGMGALKRFWNRINGSASLAGGTLAYTLSYTSNPAAYVTGETFRVLVNASCTGDSTVNINGLGAKHVYKPSAAGPVVLASGDLQAGQMIVLTYDAALAAAAGGFHLQAGLAPGTAYTDATNGGITVSGTTLAQNVADLSAVTPAQTSTLPFETGAGTKKGVLAGAANSLVNIAASTKAQMQTGTDNTTVATPARVKDSDGAAKAYVQFNAAGTIQGTAFNVSGVVKNSTGNYSVTFTTGFTSANYVTLAVQDIESGVIGSNGTNVYAQGSGVVIIQTINAGAGTALDPVANVNVVCFGRQ